MTIKGTFAEDSPTRTAEAGAERRRGPRSFLCFLVPVFEVADRGAEGRLNDISERGLQVTGIEAVVGENKTLVIRADGFVKISPFQLDAVCRWATKEIPEENWVTGFEILNISKDDLEELRKLIRLTSFCEG